MMARRIDQNLVFSSMFGCLVWLTVVSVVHADGRVFLLDQRNTSDSGGSAEAEHVCAVHDARLASTEELRHAVVECSFSACTRGWLDGGFVGVKDRFVNMKEEGGIGVSLQVETTVCSDQGSALKAVDVKIENATEDNTHLDVFCVKDKGGPCGDPPAFPNTRLQGHTGFEIGDEQLYTCLPGHVMPSGHSAFSLLCDSCGEWYGLVQLCSKYKTETHIDYEDKFTDHDHHLSYDTPAEEENTEEENTEKENTEEDNTEEKNTEEELLEEENTEEKNTEEELLEEENTEEELLEEEVDTEEEEHSDQEQQEASFSVEGEEEEEAEGEEAAGGEEQSLGEEEQQGEEVGGGMEEEVEESTDPPVEKEEQVEEMGVSEVTEAPVSLISQKHLFWFPSEAIQEAGHVEPTHPLVTQDTHTEGDNRVRASGSELMESKQDDSQPEETKDYDSHEGHFQQPIDPVDHDDHHHDDHDDHEDDVDHDDHHHDDHDDHEDDVDHDDHHHDDHDDHEDDVDHERIDREHDDQRERHHYDHDGPTDPGHDESSEGEDHVVERLDHNDHDDHESYGSEDAHREDQGEHEEDDHEKAGRYDDVGEEHYDMGEHEEDQNHGAHDDHEDHEGHDRGDVTDHHDDHGHVHDHLDEDQSEHEDDRSDPNSHDHHYDDHNYDEYVIPPVGMTTGEPQNVTHEETGAKPTASSDETWLDGYPVSQEETDADKVGGGSSEEGVELEEEEKGVVVVGVTDRPNEVELSRPTPFTGVPQVPLSPTQGANPVEQDQDQGLVGGLTPTASSDLPLSPEATASSSHSADYATHSLTSSLDDVASGNTARHSPTDSWETSDHVHPFLEHGPVPTAWTDDVIDEEERSAQHNLTRHSGEMEGEEGESEGETGETGCTGGEEDCPPPPPPSSGRGSTVAAIVVAVCAVAVAATIGAWCYRRKQQKSSMYEMNGKGQSRHGQQIEMQQKV